MYQKIKSFSVVLAIQVFLLSLISVSFAQENANSVFEIRKSDNSAKGMALAQKRPVDYVDPMIGTSASRWMIYPGPSMPFGMVKLSPDNQDQQHRKAGYEYEIENIAGFSHIHSWVMGGLLMMPANGPLQIKSGTEENPDEGYRSRFSHRNEEASPGYYSVVLDDYNIEAELTATTRAGVQRYTFPKSENSRVLIDLKIPTEYNYQLESAYIRKVSDTQIEGFSKQQVYEGFSGLINEYVIHFVAEFNQPMESFGGWSNDRIEHDTYEIHGRGDVGAFMNFNTNENNQVVVKTGISLVSTEQARLNMNKELDPFGGDFDKVRQHTERTWNDLLSLIEIEGGNEQDKKKFYTNLYRSYSARTIWSDVNGKYVDMNEQVVHLDDPDSPVYGADAFWNTFWNLNQLWGLVNPDIANSWVKSMLEIYERGGWLPKGPTGIEYSSIMVASHEVPLINNFFQKGIRNYDIEKAYEAIKHVQTSPGRPHPGGGYVGNRQLKPYMELGYVPHGPGVFKHHMGTKDEGPVSNTLEYAFDDWNVAQMAKELGKTDDYRYFKERAYNYKNVFNIEVRYVVPKTARGEWVNPESVYEEKTKAGSWIGTGFIQGNTWQYSFFVPHDVQGLIDLMGREEFNNRLNEGFIKSRKTRFNAEGDKYAEYPINHGNQPNMQAAYLFNYSGKPWLTQKWTREIMDVYYGDGTKNGWPGDEDQGQMGAWFVMSAMGLFEMDGGGSTDPIYELGSPLFEKITIYLNEEYYGGGTFVIEARNVSKENRYIQSATLDGQPLNKPWFYHRQLVDGGKLVLEMGPEPNKEWGSDPEDAPPSMSAPEK